MHRYVSVLLVVVMVAQGCSISRPPNFVGTLHAAGSNVTVNGRRVRDHTDILTGDDVATGPASSALIEFDDGGLVQLDENTDPSWQRTAAPPDPCAWLMSAEYGQFYAETKTCSLRVNLHALGSRPATRFNLEARHPSQSTLTVLSGRVNLAGPPSTSLASSQQVKVRDGRVQRTVGLSQEELKATVAWRDRYTFSTGSGGGKTALKMILATALVGVIVVVLVALLKGKDKPKRPRRKPTADATPTRTRTTTTTTTTEWRVL